MKKRDTGQAYLAGLVMDYNYFRPHMGIDDKTPAAAAGAEVPLKNWADVATLGQADDTTVSIKAQGSPPAVDHKAVTMAAIESAPIKVGLKKDVLAWLDEQPPSYDWAAAHQKMQGSPFGYMSIISAFNARFTSPRPAAAKQSLVPADEEQRTDAVAETPAIDYERLAQHEIEVRDGTLTLFHGTVQPEGETIQSFRPSRAIPMPRAKSAQYNFPGEPITALTEFGAVWTSEDASVAEQYTVPKWGADLVLGQQSQLYEMEVASDRVAYVPYTDEESVRAAISVMPEVIVLEDRNEVLVLDPALIKITAITDSEGADIATTKKRDLEPVPLAGPPQRDTVVAFHGTSADFDGTPNMRTDVYGLTGIYFTEDEDVAMDFAEANTERASDGDARTFAATIDLTNADDLSDMEGEHWDIVKAAYESNAPVVILPDMSGTGNREILVRDPFAIEWKPV